MKDERHNMIFLSHSGEDYDLAMWLANHLKLEPRLQEYKLNVFNTSEPAYRYRDIHERVLPSASWLEEVTQVENELKQYLRDNIVISTVYLLLVTQRSLQLNSKWIAFEIDVANEEMTRRLEAKQIGIFIPCVANGASTSQLPGAAINYKGVDIGYDAAQGTFDKMIMHQLIDRLMAVFMSNDPKYQLMAAEGRRMLENLFKRT